MTASEKGRELLGEIAALCSLLDDQAALLEDRDALMVAAAAEGVTHAELAEACGLSTQAINKSLGRARGRSWAT